MPMPTLDDSRESFNEDMQYMRILMDRIFRTAITQNLPIHEDTREEFEAAISELESVSHEIEGIDTKSISAGPARDANGRFVKQQS